MPAVKLEAGEFRNWAGNHRCRPAEVARPSTEEEVVELVGRARSEGKRIKVVGAGHSWSDIACTDSIMVSLDALRRIREVDFERRRVRSWIRTGCSTMGS